MLRVAVHQDRDSKLRGLKDAAARSDALTEAYRRYLAARFVLSTPGGFPDFESLPPHVALRLAYNVILRRDPDPTGVASMLPALESGELPYRTMVENLLGSDEFHTLAVFERLDNSLHASRCLFVRSLPAGRRILDLGGAHRHREEGAMVAMGYPYDFDELVVVDLPLEERHPIYRFQGTLQTVDTDHGPVRYAYHSMADLSRYDDESFDLVYSGQTFEHVTEAEGDVVLREVRRILRPGGHFALDTPNGRACRMQQPEFIDPDHEIEYDAPALEAKIAAAGFEIVAAHGLNYLGRCLSAGRFDHGEVARHSGLFAEATDCYVLAYVCRKPDEA